MMIYKCRRCQKEFADANDIPYGFCQICDKALDDDWNDGNEERMNHLD